MGWLCVLEADRTRREGETNATAEAGQELGECEVKRIYITGPMTGIEDLNGPEFDKAEEFIDESSKYTSAGFNPYQAGRMLGWDEKTPLKTIAHTLLLDLVNCDAIYMLRGWEQSKGARAEHAVAVWIGLEIMYQGGEA